MGEVVYEQVKRLRVKAVLVEQLSAIEKLVEEQRVLGRDVGLVVDGLAAAGAGGG